MYGPKAVKIFQELIMIQIQLGNTGNMDSVKPKPEILSPYIILSAKPPSGQCFLLVEPDKINYIRFFLHGPTGTLHDFLKGP